VLHLSSTAYQAIRTALGARRNFFNDRRSGRGGSSREPSEPTQK
jgi:hypothetical protein